MIMLQKCKMKLILINTWLSQIIKKGKMGNKYDSANLFLVDTYSYNDWSKNEKSTDTTRTSDKEKYNMPQLKRDEEEGKEG